MTAELQIHVLDGPAKHVISLPTYQTENAAGLDLQAAITRNISLTPGERLLVPTGLIIAIPEGYEGQVRPRSGLALKHGVTVLNAPGTIDADYRGEVSVILVNHGGVPCLIRPGDRIAQLVIAPVARIPIQSTSLDSLSTTERGAGGFGSTGQ